MKIIRKSIRKVGMYIDPETSDRVKVSAGCVPNRREEVLFVFENGKRSYIDKDVFDKYWKPA